MLVTYDLLVIANGFWKGYYADIIYYRDADGFIFPATYTYPEYVAHKEQFNNTGGSQ